MFKTEVIICNTDGCENNWCGKCKLRRMEIRGGKCENYKEIELKNINDED